MAYGGHPITTTSTQVRNNFSVLEAVYSKSSLHFVAEECVPSVSNTMRERLSQIFFTV